MALPALLHWSGGKDAAFALYQLQQTTSDYHVQHLLSTIGAEEQRVTMHGVREDLLRAQVRALGLPLSTLYLPTGIDMPTYTTRMQETLQGFVAQGIQHAVFGDIHLEDLRTYRETELARAGMTGVFPLWQQPVKELSQAFIASGFKAVVVCVNARVLDASFVGREYDAQFLADLPRGVDPCGENGEFHTFVYDGPLLKSAVVFELGEVVHRHYPTEAQNTPYDTGFYFQELL